MALLEENNVCCVCGREVHRRVGGVPAYYCPTCFEAHNPDILADVPWVKYLLNAERQRRKRRNRLLQSNYVLVPVYAASGTVHSSGHQY